MSLTMLFFLIIVSIIDKSIKEELLVEETPLNSEPMYEPVTSSDCKKKAPPPPAPAPYANIKTPIMIPKTLPVTINRLGTHVANCHLDNNKSFDEQYKVRRERE